MYMPERKIIFVKSKPLVSTSRSRSSRTAVVTQVVHTATHDIAAEEADTDHEQPAGNRADGKDGIAKGHEQLVLGQPAVGGVEGALVLRDLLEVPLGVDLIQLLGGDGGGVHVDNVQRNGQTPLAFGQGLGDLVVIDGGSAGRPGGAENAVFFAVQ